MRARRRLSALALGLVAVCARAEVPAPATQGAATVTVEVSAGPVRVGDPLAVRIVVAAPDPLKLAGSEIGGSLGPFTVTGGSWSEPQAEGGLTRWTWTGNLTAFRTGDLELPPVRVELRGADGALSAAESAAVQVTVESVLPGPADPAAGSPEQIADLKPPASVAPNYRNLIRAGVILGAALILALVLSWLYRRYAARLAAVPVPEDPFRRTPPHVWVYAELQQLLDRRLAEQGQIDLFFSELARIMKTYLGGRFRVELMERTTHEVPEALGQAGAPAPAVAGTAALLATCDLVKFAGVRPTVAECRDGVEQAYRLVDATKPADAVLAEGERGAA